MELSNAARKILNDSKLIARRDEWFGKLQNVFDGTNGDDTVFAVNGVLGVASQHDMIYTNPEKWLIECLEELAEKAEKSNSDIMFVPPCVESALYGVHFIDKIFCSNVFFKEGQWYNSYLDSPVGNLQMPDLEKDETWNLAKCIAKNFVKHDVKLPLFGLPTIASALNIGVNLYGEEILVELLMSPEQANKDLALINNLLCTMHSWYREHIPYNQLQPVISWNRTQPPGYGQLCGCTLQLISADVCRESIMPLDEKLLSVYPNGGMIHLCGSHEHLINLFKQMPSLKALQLNDRAAHDLELYYNGLRDDQIIYLNPCEGMTIEQAVKITGGRRLVIADTINAAMHKSFCNCGGCNI